MRLIDADKIPVAYETQDYDNNCIYELPREVIEDIVENCSVDAVEVIRCKDCQFADKYYHCEFTTWWNGKNDYCSKGRRREK